jgi:molybdopterin molybdotransferase
MDGRIGCQQTDMAKNPAIGPPSAAAAAADGGLLARLAGSQASSRIGSLQGADLLLEIPAALGAGTELGAQPLRLPIS